MRIYDELFKIHLAIRNKMPIFEKDSWQIPNQTRLPKDFVVAGHNQNEKFLNDWQSTIEDHADGNLKAKFIDYQNDQFTPNAELSSNHKEGFFKCIPRKLFSPTQPLVTFSNASVNRGPGECTDYGSQVAMSDDGWINKSANYAVLVRFKPSGSFGVGDLCYTHMAVSVHNSAPGPGQMAFYDTSFAMEGTAVAVNVGAPSYAWQNVSTGSRDTSGIRAGYYIGAYSTPYRYQQGDGSVLNAKWKTTSYTSLQATFPDNTGEGNPPTMKIKGEEP